VKLERPHVPVAIKVAVAERQLANMLAGDEKRAAWVAQGCPMTTSKHRYLRFLLQSLLGDPPWHLDHDPPLMLRDRTRDGGFLPAANDPDYLFWRTAEQHRIKTFVRGDGAQLSDAGKRRRRIMKLKKATRPKRKWPSRPMRRKPP
jgi:hypothetical protein